MTRPNPSRVRLRYTKFGKIRFTSHRDMARVWERTLRRIDMPVAYSEGYNPRLKLHFGLALPTGFESDGEFLDIDINPDVVLASSHEAAEAASAETGSTNRVLDLELTRSRLDLASPDGISVVALAQIDRKELSLQQAVTSCTWEFSTPLDAPALQGIVDSTLAADSLLLDRERKGKKMTDDIRPQILDLQVVDSGNTGNISQRDAMNGGPRLVAELGTQPRALRPAEFLTAIDMPSKETARVLRTHQWITNNDGEPAREPLVAGLPTAATTKVGAA